MYLLGIFVVISYVGQITIAYENGINSLFPEDYSSIYTYHVSTNTGVKKPESVTSLWELTAGIIINSNANYSIIQLTDVKMKAYNGPENEDVNFPTWSISDINDLSEPFVIQYEKGLVENIFLNPNEEVWISNIKRGLGSLLQIDIPHIDKFAFTSTEQNIYGSCLVEYTVLNETNDLSIRKFINNDKCADIPFQSWSSAPKSICPSKHQNSIISSSERYFRINNTNNETFEILDIRGHGTLLVQPFEAYGDAYYLETKQELYLKKRVKKEFPSENFLEKLTISNLTYEQNTYDFTNGRRKLTKQEKIESIHEELNKLINSFEENHSIYKTNKLHRGTLQLLYFQMRTLDISELHRIYSDIGIGTSYQQESKAGIFLELLPQIGSEASSQFIKDLILSRNVKDILAVKLLTMLPFYIEYTNDQVLASFEPLLSLSRDFSISIRHTAVLSFATMVYKTYTAGKCSVQTYEKYVRKFLDLFSDSTEYEQEMLYLQGLNNLQVGSVAKYLIPVISKGTTYSHHTRFLAIWASMYTKTLSTDEIYRIYWPILEDRTEHLEMRAVAFLMLLTSEPTTGRLVSLYWFMQKENDPHLYNFYYTTLISLKDTTYPCYLHLGTLASQIIRFVKAPETKKYWVTGNYLFDYNDANREFGSMSQFIMIGNPQTDQLNVFYVTLSNYVMGYNVNQFALYLKMQGVTESVLDKLSHMNGQNVDVNELVTILQDAKVNLQSSEPVHIEIIAKIEGKTIFSKYINETTFNLLGKVLLDLQDIKSEYHINYQHIGITLASRDFYPSDFGTTIWISTLSGASVSVRGNFTFSMENGSFMRQNDLDFRYSFQTQLTLFSYNPILDSYHGIERQKVVHGILPMLMNISLNIPNMKLSMSFQQSDTSPLPIVIFHTRLITFFRSKANSQLVLSGFCPQCKPEYEVTSINKFKNREVLNIDSKEVYRKFTLSLFNCDSPYNLKNIFYDITQSHRFNSKVLSSGKYVLFLQHVLDYISFIPTVGQCGAAFIVGSLSEKLPIIHWIMQINQQPEERQFIIKNGTTFYMELLHDYDGTLVPVFDVTLALETFSNEVSDIQFVANRKINGIEKYCFHSNTKLPQRSHDMFSYEPIEEVQIVGDLSWGNINENDTECPYNQKLLHWNITGELTDEQKIEIKESKTWPFKQCKEMKGNLIFTPLSDECYRASFAASTPRKYSMEFLMKNIPEWFYNSIKRLKCIFGIFENININQLTSLNGSVEYTENKKLLDININNENTKIENVFWDDISIFFPNMRFPVISDAIVSLGLINSCIINQATIRTFENTTIQNNDTSILAAADCSYYPKFALFVNRDINDTSLSFKMHTGKNTATVTKINATLTTLINGVEVDARNGFEYPLDTAVYDFKIFKRDHGIVEIDSKFSGTWLYFTEEYILITTPGFYKGRLCGKCILPKD